MAPYYGASGHKMPIRSVQGQRLALAHFVAFFTFLVVVVAHSCPFLSIFCHRRVSGCAAMRVRRAVHRMMGAGIVPIHT